jgi:fido (protein-threonine AMPylation protein)
MAAWKGDVSFAKLKWEDPNAGIPLLLLGIHTSLPVPDHEKMTHFFRNQLALAVYDSNRLESTISFGDRAQGSTMRLILAFFDGKESAPPEHEWEADGGHDSTPDMKSTDRQLYQCMVAVKHLLVEKLDADLTVDLIVEVHRLLMESSYVVERGDKRSVVVGRHRSAGEEVYSDDYQFLDGASVGGALSKLVDGYVSRRAAGAHPIVLAVYLLYELLTIHPFENGNGRLARLFLSWSLMRDGLPFPVSFSSGHRKAREHYYKAINMNRHTKGATPGALHAICIVSIDRVLANYKTNTSY